ncbi:SRPBCC family protein [Aeromicrobium sp. 636]|uniref:SRPBCC family protein n=1 Tax=Aeromicrobium senzhongii TaxID=2663859 RepID=A0A8I0EUT5_9ACTN|nr:MULTISPECIES: SRPBCC family protein [Aeromicrobium]MBC9225949.1 SRPBCC family protein [Aeromicrobium senzhongii]MCQ3998056.1 SRPBCC family protein [Aeromicrobium sp. 636]MTB87961.1 SRPBCC family protein [Aeromicrobium senzhongii]QNL95026.1 SRPBCC family protein [Aeromicrobium senzhongii]
MSTNTRLIETTPERVWDVLADGWLYPLWVVGASRMRDVDAAWPEVGAKLHHSVGVWPALIDDDTLVLESDPGRSLKLHARAWPAGAAEVLITLAPQGAGTNVTIVEQAVSGPATMIPQVVQSPTLHWRNTETLRRLAFLAERREASGA